MKVFEVEGGENILKNVIHCKRKINKNYTTEKSEHFDVFERKLHARKKRIRKEPTSIRHCFHGSFLSSYLCISLLRTDSIGSLAYYY